MAENKTCGQHRSSSLNVLRASKHGLGGESKKSRVKPGRSCKILSQKTLHEVGIISGAKVDGDFSDSTSTESFSSSDSFSSVKSLSPQSSERNSVTLGKYLLTEIEHGSYCPDFHVQPLCKVIFVGAEKVGKTSLVKRYVDGKFESAVVNTFGVDYRMKVIGKSSGLEFTLQLCDTSGKSISSPTVRSQCEGADWVVIVFDMSSRTSFDEVPLWFRGLDTAPNTNVLIAGNKSSTSERQVQSAEAKQFAEKYGISFFETDSLDGSGVKELFDILLTDRQCSEEHAPVKIMDEPGEKDFESAGTVDRMDDEIHAETVPVSEGASAGSLNFLGDINSDVPKPTLDEARNSHERGGKRKEKRIWPENSCSQS